ncbi:hypothetical protein BD626DRAFT_153559 [Schizophyllum amplum]|uniref:F-box domain-containing protein n=1 Tax=Schizophyllum amplum TaxID=97359 RepID=A0A550C3Q0_9AGAR|nr:hypothetical protein BD626DRAFT_153559 [Auriculariopsis ampla]
MLAEHLKPLDIRTTLCDQCGTFVSATTASVPVDTLRSYELPTERETIDLQHDVSENDAALDAYAEAITKTQIVLQKLGVQRDLLVLSAERKRALISPIRRLPAEVLSMIITHAITCTFSRKRDSTLVLLHPAMRVCQRWRALARATPHLWADIVLYPAFDRCWLKTFKKCLRWSGELSLDICINTDLPPWRHGSAPSLSEVPTQQWYIVERLVSASMRRWRTARLDGYHGLFHFQRYTSTLSSRSSTSDASP